jgi:hypothetical protein
MAKLDAMAPVMFNIQRDVECFLCASEKIIMEFAIIAETISPKIRMFNVNLGWLFSFSFTVRLIDPKQT